MNPSVALNPSLALKSVVIAGALCACAWRAEAGGYTQTDLVSDIPGLATITDPLLQNTWGVSRIATPTISTPFWISNQATQTSSLYVVNGATNVSPGPFAVDIPPAGGAGPTGQVSNTSLNFSIAGGPALFMFANLNGTISAWNLTNAMSSPNAATMVVPASGASYTGLAIDQAQNMIYAANGAGAGSIDVFNGSFAPVSLGAGAFANPFPGMVPFNVQDIGGSVYVTYAPPGHSGQTSAALGQGGVAKFSETGVLEQMMSGGQLAAPWGVALAPADFGLFSNDLLVGNFSYLHSEINAFDPTTGMFEGTIPIDDGLGNTNGGLWALTFGGGGANGDPSTLYFTDGLNGERDGLFAALSAPEPSTWALMLLGLGGLGLAARRRRTPPAIV